DIEGACRASDPQLVEARPGVVPLEELRASGEGGARRGGRDGGGPGWAGARTARAARAVRVVSIDVSATQVGVKPDVQFPAVGGKPARDGGGRRRAARREVADVVRARRGP